MMDGNALVTVILPSLNVVRYFEKCLKSVIDQSYKELEILCIDAGSTDGTLEILHNFLNSDSRIKLINSPVKSYGYQVNLGIKMAKGKYIEIVETDDYIEQDMIEKLVKLAESTGVDLVKCDICMFKDFNSHIQGEERRCLGENHYYKKILNKGELNEVQARDCNIWNGLYRKSFIEKYNIRCNETAGAAYQDIGFLIRVLNCAGSGYYIDELLYNYRTDRDESSSYSPRCLMNAYIEYRSLVEGNYIDIDGKACEDGHLVSGNNENLLVKIAKSYVWEFGKAVSSLKYDIESELIREPVLWFSELIKKSIDDGIISRCDFDERMWFEIKFIIENPGSYTEYRRVCDEISSEKKKSICARITGDDVIIVGAGQRGQSLLNVLYNVGLDVSMIADNDRSKWAGSTRFMPEITSPEEAVLRHSNSIYVIANKKYSDELREQLINLGVSEERVLFDFDLR